MAIFLKNIMIIKSSQIRRNLVITSSYRHMIESYNVHKLIYKIMIINKNRNQSQPLKPAIYIMNDRSTDLQKFNDIKHFLLSAIKHA